MAANVSENEETETETNKTKVSDSGYSNSCSNSQSQRSNSSKSRHSTSSGSSGYCGHPSSNLTSSGDENLKKKKTKVQVISATAENVEEETTNEASFTPPLPAVADKTDSNKILPACVDPAVLDNMSSPSIDSEALQVAVLAQTLYCIKTKTSEQPLDDDQEMISPPPPPPPLPKNKELQSPEMIISALNDEIKLEKEFCIVVSLSDGTVVCTTPNLTDVLGFPKDMWIGRSLINFLHPKDRIAFASHITSAMAHSHFRQKDTNITTSEKGEDSDYFYCWIRMYNGLNTTGFSVSNKKSTYLPCQLSMNFKEVPDQGVFLVASARVVKSAYKVPDESQTNPQTFTIRHTANTLISHVDNDIVSHFGYLPHDMIGRSIFDFYYAEDLPYLKDIYRNVISEEGQLFLSRPYKFRCQNGDWVMVETEWSSFINPWGKKLEFIIGRHRVLTGPCNPDVVTPVLDREPRVKTEEELDISKAFEEDIKVMLNETIVRSYDPSKQQLAQLVESMEKISSSQLQDQSTGMPAPVPSAASEMLGEISPHRVYSESKSSSETPSYNQLTYNENIQRFFASEPKTVGSDESRDTKNEQNQSSSSGGEEGKSLPNNSSFNSNSDSCLNGSGNSSGLSSNSARLKPDGSCKVKEGELKTHNSQSDYNNRPLTEEMLYQHNENMNKQMAQKHKEGKNKGQVNRKHKYVRHKTAEEIEQEEQGAHGTKRSVSQSWEGEPMKAFKGAYRGQPIMPSQTHLARSRQAAPIIPPAEWSTTPFTVPPPVAPIATHINYTSPLVSPIMQLPCVYMNTLPTAPPPPQPPPPPPPVCSHLDLSRTGVRSTEIPGTPLGMPRPPVQIPAAPYVTHQVQYMPSLMYQLPLVPMVYTQTHIIPPAIKPRMTYMPNAPHMTTLPSQPPSSRATSVKGEPGSALCSFASASLKQGRSDSSKKGNKSRESSPVCSPGCFTSHTVKTKTGTYDNDLTHDDTSFCSYSSLFPKTEKSYGSMKDTQMDNEMDGNFKTWRGTTAPNVNAELRAMRKGGPFYSSRPTVVQDLWNEEQHHLYSDNLKQEPSWMEDVEVTPDLMLRYQMENCVLKQVLEDDLNALLKFNQPEMVNEQLDQLYIDLEGLSRKLSLEESFTSSCSSGDEKHLAIAGIPSTSSCVKSKKKRKYMSHDKCAMIFEEYAPLPPSANELLMVSAHSS